MLLNQFKMRTQPPLWRLLASNYDEVDMNSRTVGL
jgi:hypothetical protein